MAVIPVNINKKDSNTYVPVQSLEAIEWAWKKPFTRDNSISAHTDKRNQQRLLQTQTEFIIRVNFPGSRVLMKTICALYSLPLLYNLMSLSFVPRCLRDCEMECKRMPEIHFCLRLHQPESSLVLHKEVYLWHALHILGCALDGNIHSPNQTVSTD